MFTDLPDWAKLPVELDNFARRAIALTPAIRDHLGASGLELDEWEELWEIIEKRRLATQGET